MPDLDPRPQTDELDWVAVLAIVIRRRRWVYSFLGIGILGALLVYALPFLGGSLTNKKTNIDATLVVSPLPESLSGYIGGGLATIVISEFQSIDQNTAVEIYRTVMAAEGVSQSQESWIAAAAAVAGHISATKDPAQTRVRLRFSEVPPPGSEYVKSLIEYQKKKTEARLRAQLERAILNWKTQQASAPEGSDFLMLQSDAQQVLTDMTFPFAVNGQISESDTPIISEGVLALMVVLGSFIAGIFATLAVESVATVYRSPAKRQLLIDAWKRTK